MERARKSREDAEWSVGERVCLVFMEHIGKYATENEAVWGEKSEQIVAFGKLGCCCKIFREYMNDPAVRRKFDYELESMLAWWM